MRGDKVIIEVTAGMVGRGPEQDYTKRWAISSDEWDNAVSDDGADDETHRFHLLLLVNGRAAVADEYARALRNPHRFNWVRTEWVFL
jgi:hypothetical protein